MIAMILFDTVENVQKKLKIETKIHEKEKWEKKGNFKGKFNFIFELDETLKQRQCKKFLAMDCSKWYTMECHWIWMKVYRVEYKTKRKTEQMEEKPQKIRCSRWSLCLFILF